MTRANEHGQPIGEPVDGWTGRPFPSRVMLPGRYVRLEPVVALAAASAVRLPQALPVSWPAAQPRAPPAAR